MKKTLNKFVKLLNECEKEYEVRYWDSGEGLDIVLPHYADDWTKNKLKVDYHIIISINDAGYVSFDYEEKENEK